MTMDPHPGISPLGFPPSRGRYSHESRYAAALPPARSARKSMLQPGTVFLDRYEIIRRVGGGGMGNVYQARDSRLSNRHCAIKEMIDLYSEGEEHQRTLVEFEREASLLATLQHPSIPKVYDYFMQNERYFLVMELIDGMDLNK